MSLFLNHPALLGLLALAAVPLLVHLLSRARPPVYHFSNTEFLRKILRLTSRLRRPRDWLLLALRTLALLAFATAFLGPLLLSKSAPLPGEKRTIVCLVDRSGSMAASDGAASRFGSACAAAASLLESTRPDLANVIWIDARPDAVFPEPGPNREFLIDELSRATVHPEPNAIEAAFELAAGQFRHAEGRRELRVFSDFQQTAWQDVDPIVPANVSLHLVPIASGPAPNVAVTSIVPVPASPVAGRTLLVQCRVANFSAEPRRVSLTLDAGGSRQSQPLDLPARGAAEAAFNVRCSAAGLLPLSAGIDADSFPLDDLRHAVVRVRESLVMAIAGPPGQPAARSLSKVAAALPWLESTVAADPSKPPHCDLLVVPAWTGTDAGILRQTASSGTAIIVFPSTPPTSAIHQLLGVAPGGDANPLPMPVPLQSNDTGWEVAPVAGHPAFALFSGGEFGNPLGGRFRERLQFPEIARTEVLASYSDQVPALITDPDLPILVANLPLDPAKTTWPSRSAFLPAIAELILHLCPPPSNESFLVEPGERAAWIAPTVDLAGTTLLEDPSGAPVDLVSTPSEDGTGTVWQSAAPLVSGLHRWTVSSQPVHYTAVNFPQSESALGALPEPPSFGPAEVHGSEGLRLAALDEGLPLWPWLIAFALLCLLLESLVATRPENPLAA